MKYLKQFFIILFFSFLGEIFHALLPFPIPASIYGILLLFLALEWNLLPLDKVKDTGKFLIEIMPIMFIPAAVGLMESWGFIKASLIPYITIPIVSTVLVMAVSGYVTQFVIRHDKKKKRKEKEISK